MNKIIIAILAIIILGGGIYYWFFFGQQTKKIEEAITNLPTSIQSEIATDNLAVNNLPATNIKPDFQPPINRADERVTKKPFGVFITPQNSPIQPEKFSGFHTGADFEIFPEESNAEVAISAVCSGKLVLIKHVSGYGGVAVEQCELDNEPITVLYGHLKLASISLNVSDELQTGDKIGNLGMAESAETDGERKHFHLAFHRGEGIELKGYVQNQEELTQWIDPCLYICDN